jgi:hypothetical protein
MPINPIIPPQPSTQVRPAGATKNRGGPKSDEEEFQMPLPPDEISVSGHNDRGSSDHRSRRGRDGPGGATTSEHPSPDSALAEDDTKLGRKLDITV